MKTRKSARGIIINSNGEILLMQFVQNKIKGDKAWWVFPGGGLESDEDYETACKRELKEELGLDNIASLKLVWDRRIILNGKDGKIESLEKYFLITIDETAISLKGLTKNEKNTLKDIKWWSLEELKDSLENFTFKEIYTMCYDIVNQRDTRYPIMLNEDETQY